MKSWPSLDRARLRIAESAHRILEQQLRIATMRADGEDTTAADFEELRRRNQLQRPPMIAEA